jgi:hypothetical protein
MKLWRIFTRCRVCHALLCLAWICGEARWDEHGCLI